MITSPSIIRPFAFGQSAGITAGLSTRDGGPEGSPFGMNLSFNVGDNADLVTQNRARFFGALGIGMDELAFMQQVHGGTVTRVDTSGVYPACDGMITDQSRLFLCVTVADCVPIFMCGPCRACSRRSACRVAWDGGTHCLYGDRGIGRCVRCSPFPPGGIHRSIGGRVLL